MRAIISVIGHDKVGILAKVTAECAARGINVMDVTQSVLQDMFAMIMLVDLSEATAPMDEFADVLDGSRFVSFGVGLNNTLSMAMPPFSQNLQFPKITP